MYADGKDGNREVFTCRQADLESKEGGIIYGHVSSVKYKVYMFKNFIMYVATCVYRIHTLSARFAMHLMYICKHCTHLKT